MLNDKGAEGFVLCSCIVKGARGTFRNSLSQKKKERIKVSCGSKGARLFQRYREEYGMVCSSCETKYHNEGTNPI